MLKFMRRHARGFLIKALFALIIIVFIFWGIGSFRERERVIAKVNGKKIGMGEFEENYRKIYSLKAKDDIEDKDIKEIALQDLIDRYVLVFAAEDAGIKISEAEFFEYLSSLEIFKKEGEFDRSRYVEILKRSNIDPKIFEEKERRALLASKMANIIRDNVFLNDEEVWAEYVRLKGMVELSYMVFDPQTFVDKITIDEKEVETLYEREKEKYREEDLYRLRYILINDKSPVKEETAYMELLKEKNLETYARKKGLAFFDLGWKTEIALKEDFKGLKVEEWLRDLRKGEISLPQKLGGAFYIFELVDFKRGDPLKKEVAMGIIKAKLKKDRALLLAKAKAEEIIDKGSFSWNGKTGLIPRNSTTIKGIGKIPEDAKGLLNLNEREKIFKKPVQIEGKFYIFAFEREEPPKKDIWDKEKTLFSEFILSMKKEEALRDFLNGMKKQMDIKIYREFL